MGTPRLARRLGLGDAVFIGLGAMVGAGVFASFAPAARAAGPGLLVGLLVAAVIAFCNATASAQLAAQYPTSGGTYVYGRERLGPWWGFIAGWGFVVGKTASCAAMALTFASYAVPGHEWASRLVAVVAVVTLAGLNLGGISRTAALTRILVTITLLLLAVLVVGIATGNGVSGAHLSGWSSVGVYGVLQSAGLLFFAFAGYARIATLGEEVRDPGRTIPRAVTLSLAATVGLYAIVGVTVLAATGSIALAHSSAPLATAAHAAGVGPLVPLARVGAAVAALGALLALITGVGRTTLAMARNRDLPAALAYVEPARQVPRNAEVALAVIVCVLVACVDLREVIGFSSFGVLVYYAVANTAAATQDRQYRRWSRPLNALGALGCLLLVATLPRVDVVAGIVVFAVGLTGRAFVLRRRGTAASRQPVTKKAVG